MSSHTITNEPRGYRFLSVRSAEGRRAPENRNITEAQYEKAREAIIARINESTSAADIEA
jgi:hypothetical protein